jgi:putative transposase
VLDADRDPQSSSTAEAFVKTFPITSVVGRPDAVRVLRQLDSWLQHCNSVHPHKGLGCRSRVPVMLNV